MAEDTTDTWYSMTVAEAAQHLGLSRRTIYRWIQRGWLRAKVMRNGRYRVSAFDVYVNVPFK